MIGEFQDQPVLAMQGRVHFYEGYGMAQVSPACPRDATPGNPGPNRHQCGGRRQSRIRARRRNVITDHLNLLGMMGSNPLMGPNYDELGPRFPDMSQAYDRALAATARDVAADQQITLQEGIYAGLSGPFP